MSESRAMLVSDPRLLEIRARFVFTYQMLKLRSEQKV